MQEQMVNAMLNAAGANSAEATAPAGKPAGGTGQRLLVAMIQARESGCKCGSCVLLRQEVDTMMTAMLKGIAESGGSPDTEPDAGTAN